MSEYNRCNNNTGCLFDLPSKCVYYDGPYLDNLDVLYREDLKSILKKINDLIGTGGGGGVGSLQAVTNIGQTTSRSIFITGQDGFGSTSRGLQFFYSGSGGTIQSYGTTNNLLPITIKGSHVSMLSTTSGLDAVNGDDYVTLNQMSSDILVDFTDDYFDL